MQIRYGLWSILLFWILSPLAAWAEALPHYGVGDMLIYDGETGSAPVLFEDAGNGSNRCLFYLESTPNAGLNGNNALQLKPDKWHGPAYRLYCGGGSRRDFSAHDILEFYFRCPAGYSTPPVFHLSTWDRSSNTVNILDFIEGGVIDTSWRRVQIPLNKLATPAWTLGNVETLAWPTDDKNRTCYVDNIALRDITRPTVITQGETAPTPVSNRVLRLTFSEAYAASSIRTLANYTLHSTTDSTYSSPVPASDTGMHYRMQHFDNSGIPKNRYDLFLQFAKPLKNGQEYTLTVQGVQDLSDNTMAVTQYRFTYNDRQQLNTNIKVNQVGYLPERPKVGYVGGYLGDLGGGVWAVGTQGNVLFHDPQNGWQAQSTPVTSTLRAVTATREDSAWAVGDGGVILHWNGQQWTRVTSPVSTNLLAIAFDPLNQGWIVGEGGVILRYTGSAWVTVVSPTASSLRGVLAETGSAAWAVGDNGTIIRWNGVKWVMDDNVTNVTLHAVGGSKADDLWAVGDNGTILQRQYGHWKPWADKPTGTPHLYSLAWNHSGAVWAAGDNGALWYKTGFGSNAFTALASGSTTHLRAVVRQNSRQFWGSDANGALITNTGGNWQTAGDLHSGINGMFALPYGALRLPDVLPNVSIQNAQDGQTVLSVPLTLRYANWHLSGEDVYQFDFSALTTAGEYRAYIPGIGVSDTFKVSKDTLNSVAYTTARGLFYQRSGTALTEPYAEARFTRPLSHEYAENGRKIDGVFDKSLSTSPLYHNESIGGLKDVHGGWHDAGDYGKYMPTAATALWYLLTAYDMRSEQFRDNAWNIPESTNGVPDLLDEARWELDWIARLQDSDGGVYHKVTSECWFGDMPHKETTPRHIYAKTTHDTALAAALFASAARVWKPYDATLANRYLQQARLAWSFLQAHPSNTPVGGFKNVANNCSGEYNDADDSDNRLWAAAELNRTTGESAFRQYFDNWWASNSHTWGWHEWQHFYKRAYWAYLRTPAANANAAAQQEIRNKIILDANNSRIQTLANPYQNGARLDVPDWLGWGTFTQSTLYAFPLLQAWALTGDEKYRDTAALNLDAQLGANPLAFSFITGIGKRYPHDPLHTVSIHDGVDEPVPGIPVFGIFAHMSNGKTPQRKAQEDANNYPTMLNTDDPYPILRRYTDESDLVEMSEFTIQEMAIATGVFGLMAEPLGVDPLIDTDGDGIPNPQDTDDDGDGMPDTWEIQYGLNALDAADASLDKDGDGIANREEYQQGTDPTVKDGKPDLVVSIAPVTSVTPDTFTSHVVTVSNTGVKAAADITLNIQSPDKAEQVAFQLEQGEAECPLSVRAALKNGCSHLPTGEMFLLGEIAAGQTVTVTVVNRYSAQTIGSELRLNATVTSTTPEQSLANNTISSLFVLQAKRLLQGCDYRQMVQVSPFPQTANSRIANHFHALTFSPSSIPPLTLFGYGEEGQQVMLTGDGFQWNGVDDYGTYPPSLWAVAKSEVGNRHVGVATLGGLYWSDDRVTWTPATYPSTALYDVIYAKGRYVAVGAQGTILTSSDGSNWQPVLSGTTAKLAYVDYGNNELVAGGQGIVLTSPDGLVWTIRTSNSGIDSAALEYGAVWNGSQYLLFDAAGDTHVLAANLTNLAAATPFRPTVDGVTESATVRAWSSVHWQDNQYIALTSKGLLISSDGHAWVTQQALDYPYIYQRLGDKAVVAGSYGSIWVSACAPMTTLLTTFLEQRDVKLSTLMESNTLKVSGLTGSVSLTVSGGEYRKNGGAYTKTKGTVQNGDTLQVRHTSSSKSNTAVTTTLKAGTNTYTFKSTTFVMDSTPDLINWIAKTGVTPTSLVESNVITLSGINVPVAVSVTGGEYRINGGAYTKSKGTAKVGDTLQLRQITSSKSNTTVKTTLTVGGVKPVFSTTTLVIDSTPDAFSFTALTGIALNSWVESESITVSGINTAVAVSISGGEYSVNGGEYTKAKGVAKAGDTLQVRHMSSKSSKKTVTTSLTVGTVKAAFKSTTQ